MKKPRKDKAESIKDELSLEYERSEFYKGLAFELVYIASRMATHIQLHDTPDNESHKTAVDRVMADFQSAKQSTFKGFKKA